MFTYIGTVADVASGELKVGYADLGALKSDSEIYGEAGVYVRPFGVCQLKVGSVPGSSVKVSVSVVDLSVGVESVRYRACVAGGAIFAYSETTVWLAENLKPSVLTLVKDA